MAAANRNVRFPAAGFNPRPPIEPLAEHVRHYFDRHPEVSREEFLLGALRKEIHFREQRETDNAAGLARWEGEGMNTPLWRGRETALRRRRLPSAEDIRLHAWLAERLAVLHHERHGLWPKLRRLVFENRLVRWLSLQA
jgi:hypothetical protein